MTVGASAVAESIKMEADATTDASSPHWQSWTKWLRPSAWAYAVAGSRDYRLDLLRGFLVFAMVVDHVGGRSFLTAVTGDNRFLVSAAEGFIFVSGLLMGIVYGGRIRRFGLKTGVTVVLRRAVFLYTTVSTLTLTFVAMFLFTELPLWLDRSTGLGVQRPLDALIGTVTLHYSYHATDVLLIYVLLVGLAPIAFYLLDTGRTRFLIAGSATLWALYQVAPGQAEMPWTVANSVFPFSAWQLLFYAGLTLGYHRTRLGLFARWLRRWPIGLLLVAATAGMILLSQANHAGRLTELGVPGLSQESFDFLFAKPSLGPGRVAAFVLVAALAQQVVTRLWVPLNAALGWLLLPLGQKSLLAYGTHLFVIGPAYAVFGTVLYSDPADELLNSAIQLAMLSIVWGVVKADPLARMLVGRLKVVVSPSARPTLASVPALNRGGLLPTVLERKGS